MRDFGATLVFSLYQPSLNAVNPYSYTMHSPFYPTKLVIRITAHMMTSLATSCL